MAWTWWFGVVAGNEGSIGNGESSERSAGLGMAARRENSSRRQDESRWVVP